MLGEKLAKVFVERDPVRVNPEVKATCTGQRRTKFGYYPPQLGSAGEQRLTAVQNYVHGAQLVLTSMLRNALRRLRDRFIRDGHGTAMPALVSGLVDIAMIAR
jgi:hypothetical protein